MTLKEARTEARNRATDWHYVDIYQEPDGTFSLERPANGRAVFVVAIDKSGGRYKKQWQKVSWSNQKKLCYVRIK